MALVALAALAAAVIAASFGSSRAVLTPAQVLEHDPGNQLIQVTGAVARARLLARGDLHGFVLSSGGQRLRVRYTGIAVDGLVGQRVTVTGRYRHGQLLAHGEDIQITCANTTPDQHC